MSTVSQAAAAAFIPSSLNFPAILILVIYVFFFLGLLPWSARRLGNLGITNGTSGSVLSLSRTLTTADVPAMTLGHLSESFFGTLGVLETHVLGYVVPVCVGFLRHVVEDGFDEAEFVLAEAGGGFVAVGSLLRGHCLALSWNTLNGQWYGEWLYELTDDDCGCGKKAGRLNRAQQTQAKEKSGINRQKCKVVLAEKMAMYWISRGKIWVQTYCAVLAGGFVMELKRLEDEADEVNKN